MIAPRHSTADIIAAIASAAHPLSTLEVATLLRTKATVLSTRLSKLADSGMITREHRGEFTGAGVWHKYCVWSAAI